jgi:hypothetical protein
MVLPRLPSRLISAARWAHAAAPAGGGLAGNHAALLRVRHCDDPPGVFETRPESKSPRPKARPGGLPLSAAGAAAALPGESPRHPRRIPDLSLRRNLGPHGGEWSHAIENPRVMLDWPIVLTKVETGPGPGNLTF